MKRLSLFRHPYFSSCFKRRVLEVGGGHAPFAGVTHAVDKYPDDNTQRAGNLALSRKIDFRQGDLENIPFPATPPFGFIFVSHVLEHVGDPVKAVSEINRVARAGYIETPSPIREQIAARVQPEGDFHPLFCWSDAKTGTVHVVKKTQEVLWTFCSCENGKRTKRLLEHTPVPLVELEALFPRNAKTEQLHFRAPLRVQVHSDFESACRSGACPYRSIRSVLAWSSLPLRLLFRKFGRLRWCVERAGALK